MFFTFLKKEQRMFPLCNFKTPVFVTETESVFLMVRTEYFKYCAMQKAGPWLKKLVAGLSSRMSGFDPGPFHVRSVGTQWHYDSLYPSTSHSPVSNIYFTPP